MEIRCVAYICLGVCVLRGCMGTIRSMCASREYVYYIGPLKGTI